MMWPAADFHGFISPFSRTRNTLFPDLITRWSLPRFFFGSCLLHFLIPTFQHSLSSFFFSKIVSSRVWVVLFYYFDFFFHNKNPKRDFLGFFNHILSKTNSSCRFWFSLWVNTIEILISGALETIDQITIM